MHHHAVHKRSACDRCRDQKLRCLRSDRPNGSCARCQRAGANCFTSSSRPLGRPRIVYGQNAVPSLAETSPMTTAQTAAAAVPPHWGISNTRPSPPCAPVQLTPPLQSDSEPWPHFDVSAILGSTMDDSLLESLHLQGQGLLGESGLGDYGMNVDDANERALNATLDSQEYGQDKERRSPIEDVPIELSRLSHSMTLQLSKAASYSERSQDAEKFCAETVNSVEGNPMAEVLQITARFITVLKRLVQQGTAASNDYESPIPTTSASSSAGSVDLSHVPLLTPSLTSNISETYSQTPLSIATVLLVLSNHLQLLQIWNALMSDACAAILRMPRTVIESIRAPSNCQITGLPGMQGRLYAKLVIQVIKDQLSSVEKLLALPPEYCLYPAKTSSTTTGVFSNDRYSTILRGSMSGADVTSSSGDCLLLSLRELLEKAVQVLDDGN